MLQHWSPLAESGLALVSAGILLTAALHDLIARTVPNWMALALAACGLAIRVIDGSLAGGLVAGLLTFLFAAFCWRRGWMGGGDVKLLAAAALAVPPAAVLHFVLAVAIAGGLLAAVYLAGRRLVAAPLAERPSGLLARALRVERWRIRRGGPLPYACAIAAGGLFILL